MQHKMLSKRCLNRGELNIIERSEVDPVHEATERSAELRNLNHALSLA